MTVAPEEYDPDAPQQPLSIQINVETFPDAIWYEIYANAESPGIPHRWLWRKLGKKWRVPPQSCRTTLFTFDAISGNLQNHDNVLIDRIHYNSDE